MMLSQKDVKTPAETKQAQKIGNPVIESKVYKVFAFVPGNNVLECEL